MKKQILTIAIIASMSSASFASTNQEDTLYLFGNENVEISLISADEMATTEGQLFGITSETIAKYIAVAAAALTPKLKAISNDIAQGVTDGMIRSVKNFALHRDPNGSPTAALIGRGFTDGVSASLGGTFSLSNLLPTTGQIISGAANEVGNQIEEGVNDTVDNISNTINDIGSGITGLLGRIF